MNLLITGGQGGIGQEVVHALGDAHDTRVVTLGRTPLPAGSVLPASLRHEAGFVLDEGFLTRVLNTHGITHIIHATGARTRECEADALLAHESKAAAELATRDHTGAATFQTAILRPGFVLGTRSQSSLYTFIRDAMTQPHASLTMAERFHLHWATDLARTMLRLIVLGWPDKVAVYHPPGLDLTLPDFAAEVSRAAASRQLWPELIASPDPAARVPASLASTRFMALFGSIPLTPLAGMIEQVVNDELS